MRTKDFLSQNFKIKYYVVFIIENLFSQPNVFVLESFCGLQKVSLYVRNTVFRFDFLIMKAMPMFRFGRDIFWKNFAADANAGFHVRVYVHVLVNLSVSVSLLVSASVSVLASGLVSASASMSVSMSVSVSVSLSS
jgi:hypothetical protein